MAPSRCGTDSLWHRLAVAPTRCGTESPRHRVAPAPPCLARRTADSLWRRLAVAPTRCGTDSLWHRLAPAPSRCAQQTAPAPAALSLRTQRLGRAAHTARHRAPPRASPPRAQGPSGHGAATRLSPSDALPKSNPGTVAADAATWARRPSPRPNGSGSPRPTNGPCASCAVATHSAARHARRTRRATARLATSCAGGPSARGSATRLSASGALPRPCPGLLRVGAVCPTRRSRARGSEGRAPRRGAGRSPAESPSQSPGRRPSRRGSGCYEVRPSSGGLPRLLGTAGSRRRGRTCPRARRRQAPGWGWARRP